MFHKFYYCITKSSIKYLAICNLFKNLNLLISNYLIISNLFNIFLKYEFNPINFVKNIIFHHIKLSFYWDQNAFHIICLMFIYFSSDFIKKNIDRFNITKMILMEFLAKTQGAEVSLRTLGINAESKYFFACSCFMTFLALHVSKYKYRYIFS